MSHQDDDEARDPGPGRDEVRRGRGRLHDASFRELACELLRRIEIGSTPPLSRDELSELLVLLTAVRTLHESSREPPAPSKIDECVEDMIDPEFGLRPAREIILEAAKHILRGNEAFHLPRARTRPGRLMDED